MATCIFLPLPYDHNGSNEFLPGFTRTRQCIGPSFLSMYSFFSQAISSFGPVNCI